MKLYGRFAGAVVIGDVKAAAFEHHRRGNIHTLYLPVAVGAYHLGPVSVQRKVPLEALSAFWAYKAVTRHKEFL
jgi:hypothetical protein